MNKTKRSKPKRSKTKRSVKNVYKAKRTQLIRLAPTEFSRSPTTSSLSGHYVPAKWFAKGEQPARSKCIYVCFQKL